MYTKKFSFKYVWAYRNIEIKFQSPVLVIFYSKYFNKRIDGFKSVHTIHAVKWNELMCEFIMVSNTIL